MTATEAIQPTIPPVRAGQSTAILDELAGGRCWTWPLLRASVYAALAATATDGWPLVPGQEPAQHDDDGVWRPAVLLTPNPITYS